MKKQIKQVRSRFEQRLQDTCNRLTPRQRKTFAFALLLSFAVLSVTSIVHGFRDNTEHSNYGRIESIELAMDSVLTNQESLCVVVII